MPEGGIGLVRHAAEVGVGDFTADKWAEHIARALPIRPAEKSADDLRRKLRPRFRHVEAAVAGEPGQHHVAEAKSGSLPPRRNIPRQAALQRLEPNAKPFILIDNRSLPMAKPRGTIKRFRVKWKPRFRPHGEEARSRAVSNHGSNTAHPSRRGQEAAPQDEESRHLARLPPSKYANHRYGSAIPRRTVKLNLVEKIAVDYHVRLATAKLNWVRTNQHIFRTSQPAALEAARRA